jgi:hypothetical protein
VNHLLFLTKATKQLTGYGRKRSLPGEEIGKGGRYVVQCCRMKQATLITEQNAELGSANTGGVLQHRLEHRLQFARRT